MKLYDVFGLGNAIVDVLVNAEETDLLTFQLTKGQMRLVEEKELGEIIDKIEHLKPVYAPGGSVANTCSGVVRLGGKSIFCGIVSPDKRGSLYEAKMQKEGVDVRIVKEDGKGGTATAVTFVTPDSERSFATYLGVSVHMAKENIVEEDLERSKIAHFEGYILEGSAVQEVSLHVMELAKEHQTKISLDVSDAGLIKRMGDKLISIIKDHVDILFCNEMEAVALTGKPHKECLDELSQLSEIAVLKLGKEGSIIRRGSEEVRVAGISSQAVDTTGAGDMYAAGFLFGLARDYPLAICGKIASFAAAKVVEKMGARLDYDLEKDCREIVEQS